MAIHHSHMEEDFLFLSSLSNEDHTLKRQGRKKQARKVPFPMFWFHTFGLSFKLCFIYDFEFFYLNKYIIPFLKCTLQVLLHLPSIVIV